MNILPFVFIFLALFTLLSTSFLTKERSLALEQKAYHSYMDAERQATAAIIRSAYAKIPTPKTTSGKEKALAVVKNWREQPSKLKQARLNIYALLHDDTPPAYLKQTFYALMDELYADLPLYVELKRQGQLPAFFAGWHGHADFADIAYDDPDFSLLFYKMRKGCVCYDTEAPLGYPPLEDFIHSARSGAERPMPWRLARPPLLRAYFGHLACTILSLEAEKPHSQATLTFEELDKLLQTHPDIPKELLSSSVANTFDSEFVGTSPLTKVRHGL